MKKTIISFVLAVICLSGFGQKDTSIVTPTNANYLIYVSWDSMNYSVEPYNGNYITVQDLIDYQEYCYSDSVLSQNLTWFDVSDNALKDVYEPHEIPTLNGFINWIKKKYK